MPASTATAAEATASFQSGLEKAWQDAAPGLPGGDWMTQLRRDALARVVRDGLPGRRNEWWKYADLAGMRKVPLPVAPEPSVPLDATSRNFGEDAWSIVVRNGRVAQLPSAPSLPDGIEVVRLGEALDVPSLWLRPWLQPAASAIHNLNLAFATDGVLLRIGRNVSAARPLVIVSHARLDASMAHERSVVSLEEGASLTLVELDQMHGSAGSVATKRLSINLAPGARLMHIRLSAGGPELAAVHDCDVQLGANARYQLVTLCAGAELLRQQQAISLSGEAASCDLAIAYAARAGAQVDQAVEIRHTAPNTQSRLLAKGLATRKGRGVVQGRVVVDETAQGADSHQMARGLLLEDGAEIFHKPELEIYADDVKCGHGATIASLDPSQLFYLQSRGIPAQAATEMLLAAFVRDVIDRAPETLQGALASWADTTLFQRKEPI
jgi:Fe-S cluster assembly protein SufD